MINVTIGEGIAFAGACFAGASVSIVAIKQKYAMRNGKDKQEDFVNKELCTERHNSIQHQLEDQTVAINRIDSKINILLGINQS